MKLRQVVIGLSSAGLLLLSAPAQASLFYQNNQDAAGLGDAQAGKAAIADDASTEFYNPAGLVRIPNQQLVLGDNLSMPSYEYSGSSTYNNGFTQTQSGDAQGAEYYQFPYLHYAAPISDKFSFGFGTSSPFMMDTNWGDDDFTTPLATTSKLKTYDISTDLAYAITKRLSVGAGIDFVRVIISNYDHETPYNNGNSRYDTTGDGYDWSDAWHAGALLQLTDHTRLGASYHSSIDFQADGNASTTTENGTDLVSSNNYRIDGTLPATSTVSVFHQLNPTWAVMAGVTYMQWNQFSDVSFYNVPTNSGVISKETVDYGLQNNWLYSVGAHYTLTPQMMLRVGVGYETSPIRDDSAYFQTPGSEVYNTSVGMHYKANEEWAFDIGWSHYFYKNQDIETTDNYSQNDTTTTGTMDSSADMIGVQFVWNMS